MCVCARAVNKQIFIYISVVCLNSPLLCGPLIRPCFARRPVQSEKYTDGSPPHTPLSQVLPDGEILVSAEGINLRCRTMVNCAGLSAVALARAVRGSNPDSLPEAFFAKGNYFRYAGVCVCVCAFVCVVFVVVVLFLVFVFCTGRSFRLLSRV